MEGEKEVKTSCKLTRPSKRAYGLELVEGGNRANLDINFERNRFGIGLSNGEQNYNAAVITDFNEGTLTVNYSRKDGAGRIVGSGIMKMSFNGVPLEMKVEGSYSIPEVKPTIPVETPEKTSKDITRKSEIPKTFILGGKGVRYASRLDSLIDDKGNIKETDIDENFSDPNDRRGVKQVLGYLKKQKVAEITDGPDGHIYHVLDRNVFKIKSTLFGRRIKKHVLELKPLVKDGRISKAAIEMNLLHTRGDKISWGRTKKRLIEEKILEEEEKHYRVLEDLSMIT